MTDYITPDHPDAFVDYPKRPCPAVHGYSYECAKCKGHGGWNLQLNAYSLHDRDDTPENRHRYSHFKAACDNCYGWGYVSFSQGDHVHEWEPIDSRQARCMTEYKCKICGARHL